MTRQEVIDQARTWLGTPFRHQGRLKGIGVDCVGLIIGVTKELGLNQFDTKNYSRYPDVKMMGDLLAQHLEPIKESEALLGDVVWIKVNGNPQHLAMLTDKGIIHAHSIVGKCVETVLDKATKRLIVGYFRIKGIE